MGEPSLRARQRVGQLAGPVRHCVAQSSDQHRQAERGEWRVGPGDHVDQRVEVRAAGGGVVRDRPVFVRGVDADARVPARDAQQSAVVHRVEQMGGGVRGATPVVGDSPVREMAIDIARMHGSARAHEVEQRAHAAALSGPPGCGSAARVHQRLHGAGNEAVVHEDVLVNIEIRVVPFEIAGAIVDDAVAQREILRAGRRPDRIGLDETESVEGALQRRRREERARDRRAAQVIECHGDSLCMGRDWRSPVVNLPQWLPVLASRRVAVAIALAAMACPRIAGAQGDRASVVVVDRDMTPAAGTEDIFSLERAAAAFEDRWLMPTRFDESTGVRRGLGIAYRLGKWYGLNLPQDHFLMVVGHEVFGHGARLREIGARSVDYSFDIPIPYGPGGAVTSFNGNVAATRADVLAVDTGGIEAQNVLADHIARDALATGAIGYRASWLYLESRLDGLRYIRSVSSRSSPGHDVRSFLLDFNEDCDPPVCTPIDAATLKRRALAMLGDPMLAYAGYAWAGAYMVRGESSAGVPMIPLKHDVKYLPALRFEMTPYGTAITTEHDFARRGRLARGPGGAGDTGARHTWDVGASVTNVLPRARLRGDLSVSVWNQPALDSAPNSQVFNLGGLAAATVRIPLGQHSRFTERTSVLVQAGYKSDGFVRGERLHAGPILRVGVTLP